MKKRDLVCAVAVLLAVFSFAIIGCKNDSDSKDPPLTLTLTNYPYPAAVSQTGKMIGASLLADTKTDAQPVAAGFMPVLDGTTATYTFYYPMSSTDPTPDQTRPFTVSGSYFPALAEVSFVDPTGPRIVRDYNGAEKLSFSSSTPNHTVDFISDFTIRASP